MDGLRDVSSCDVSGCDIENHLTESTSGVQALTCEMGDAWTPGYMLYSNTLSYRKSSIFLPRTALID